MNTIFIFFNVKIFKHTLLLFLTVSQKEEYLKIILKYFYSPCGIFKIK